MGYYSCNHSTLGGILELVTNKLMVSFKTNDNIMIFGETLSGIVNEVYEVIQKGRGHM